MISLTLGWLDKLARWLEKQPITADGQQHTLAAWPDLGDGRTITAFVQVSAAYLAGRYADGVEDWAVSLSMRSPYAVAFVNVATPSAMAAVPTVRVPP